MRCTSPRTVGFKSDGKTISWSPRNHSKEFATFQLPCSKCIECRLDYARQWAIRCVHEAQMHPENAFITLTYDDTHLKSPKLDYRDFQLFMKSLRKQLDQPIGMFTTGEYGELTKRPHWHAIIFNWYPKDAVYKRSNDRGDKIYSSGFLDRIWKNGSTEVGSVTFESAGYCARYAAKKLVHGKDNEHDFQPISKKSSKHAIGKKWLEQYHADVFNTGELILKDGTKCGIPRYYSKWYRRYHPENYNQFVTKTRHQIMEQAQRKTDEENLAWLQNISERNVNGPIDTPLTSNEIRSILQKEKFNRLQNFLKLK
ncbi:MAG: replication initiator protein [Microvirus sp.]|nr:MAG: replication initiator protein [Microvirus sp.]